MKIIICIFRGTFLSDLALKNYLVTQTSGSRNNAVKIFLNYFLNIFLLVRPAAESNIFYHMKDCEFQVSHQSIVKNINYIALS